MNQTLFRLLREAGVERAIAWNDLLVVQNYAPVPPPPARAGTRPFNRGLNCVVLDGVSPSHFCKVRPRDEANLLRETRARNCLATVDSTLRVPPATCVSSETITLQVSAFLPGPHLGKVVAGQSTTDFVAATELVLRGLGPLADRALQRVDVVDCDETISLAAVCAEALEYLSPLLEFDQTQLSALSAVFDTARSIVPRPQHGDLWWRNVIVFEDHYWAIDLEDYGDICVPLFDDLTLLASTLSLRGRGDVAGIEALCGHQPDAIACRSILASRAEEEGLSPDQIDGVLAYYVLTRARTVHYRAGSEHAGLHMASVRYVVDRFAKGDRGLLSP